MRFLDGLTPPVIPEFEWTTLLEVSIPGQPVPAGREPCLVNGGRPTIKWTATYREWSGQAVIYLGMMLERGLLEPLYVEPGIALRLSLEAVFPRPKRKPSYTITEDDGTRIEVPYRYPWTSGRNVHLGASDWDNISKGPPDVLKKAGILHDDRWIWWGALRKWYAAEDEVPHVSVRLRAMMEA